MGPRQIARIYLVLCAAVLHTTSPAYRHELGRISSAALRGLHTASAGFLGAPDEAAAAARAPRSGLYRSTELLAAVQQGMRANASAGGYASTAGLVAYMSAGDAIQGQGWRARATLFVQLLSPRYTLLPLAHPSLRPQLRLLELAASDLPAVARLAGSEDASVGYRLVCSSPALEYGLGPQPVATCSVWQPPGPTGGAPGPAARWQGGEEATEAPGGGGAAARQPAAAAENKPVAVWTIVPSSYGQQAAAQPAAPAAHALDGRGDQPSGQQQQQQQQQVLLGSGPADPEQPSGALLAAMQWCDTWFLFPRAPLLRLLPAMGSVQQLLFAHAVVAFSWGDLLHVVSSMQRLHARMRAADPFAARSWPVVTAAASVALHLLLLLAARVVVSTALAFAALAVLRQMLLGVRALALALQLPVLRLLPPLLRAHGALRALAGGGSAAAGAAASAAAGGGGAATAAAAAAPLRQLLAPWHGWLLGLHRLCEDLLWVTAARLVWELQELALDAVWRGLVAAVAEVHAALEASAAGGALLLSGASWRAAWARFAQLQRLTARQRRADAAGGGAGGEPHRVQAQVFIQAPADMGQAAEALRTLADELEQLGDQARRLAQRGRRRAQPVPQALGQHWPAPLALPFDADALQAELGAEVPRGFVCPITREIMQQPALLICSSVAVPATYDKAAIERWLESNRVDPKSRQALAQDAQLVPNLDLHRAIEDWAAEKAADLEARRARQRAARHAAAGPQSEAAAAAAAAAAAPHAVPPLGLAAAVAGAGSGGGPKPSASAGAVCSSLLAAMRGAVGGGRRAGGWRGSGGRGAGGGPPPPPAAAPGDGDACLSSDEEVDGPPQPAAAAAAPQEGTAAWHRLERHQQQQQRQQQQQQRQQQQGEDDEGEFALAAAAGRYNLRQRRGAAGAAWR